MAWSVARGAAIGFIVVLAVLIAYAAISFQNINRLQDQDMWVTHTYQVLGELEGLTSSLKDAETGQRGFLITGDESYLEPYHKALSELQSRQDRLRQMVADNPPQVRRVVAAGDVIAERMKELEDNVALRKADNLEAARQQILTGAGKKVMDDLRRRVDEMESAERELLAQRQAEARDAYRMAMIANFLSLIVAGIALAVAWWLIRRELEARNIAVHQANEQRERLLTTLTSIGDAVIVADTAGRVALMNPVAEKLTGWGREALGHPLFKVFHIVNEFTRAVVENPVDVVLQRGAVVGLANHTVLIAKDATERPIDDSGAPIRDEEGNIVGVVLVFRDISDRRQAEVAQESLNLQLREADSRKDQFLATLAHELRNPLAPLANALELWPAVENNRNEMEDLRKLMERQVQQMIRLIDDLLDLSRITRGKVQLRPQSLDVGTLINGAIESIGPFIQRCGHELLIDLPEQPLLVYGDVARLVQVMANILHNAAKYTGRDGTIRVSATRQNGEAVISVRDNGPGIPPAMLAHIFDMFTQGEHTLDRAHGGLGIGLTLVKNLVELHGGSVSAASDGVGKGSEFIVRLPLSMSPLPDISAKPHADSKRPAAFAPPHRVLVVDDVQASAQTLAMMLKAIGQEVEVRHDGASAIEAIEAFNPDVVFMDIGMPKMNGYDAARTLRQRPQLANLILVALTGFGQDEDRRKALEAGFNYHLVKPASLDTLEQLLQTVPSSTG